ncbi:MAG: TetR family transcriptional regulator [Aeromicrobium erythreum]
MATRAQLSQERSRQRREELLTAAIELFAEGGSRAVTHRAVAKRAGLPPATTTYYFESIEDLLREALAEHIASWRAELDLLSGLDDLPSSGMKVTDATGLIAAIWSARGPEVAAVELSIFLAATQDPALREEARLALVGFEELAARWLGILGVPRAEGVAAAVLALIAGSALRRQSGQYPEDREAQLLSEAIRDLVAAHLLGRERADQLIADETGASVD